jgi:hypothetical protein
MRRKCPVVIALLSAFLIFVGSVTFLLHLFQAALPQGSFDYVSSRCGATGYIARHFGLAGLRVELATIGLVLATIGIGLWRLLPWARTALIWLSCVAIFSVVEQMVEMRVAHPCDSIDMIAAAGGVFLLFYCSRTTIKDTFLPPAITNPTSTI